MNTTRPVSAAPHRPAGFSLLEVLIALFVLSIGLLGLAALQTVGLQYNVQSYQRTQAVFQAYDLIDRIRANSAGKTAGYYNAVSLGATPSYSNNCATTSCNPQDLANYDINKWNTANAQLLSEGKGSVSTNGNRRTVTLQWRENDLNLSFVVETEL